MAPLRYSDIICYPGKDIALKVPYPLLKNFEEYPPIFYDQHAFSCMNFHEFASDLWGAVFWEHDFKGFFLSKIPLMKRLKWREVATVKALWGTFSDKNNVSLPNTDAIFRFPEGMSSVSKAACEAGVGIENIFRFIRLDAIWRLTHRGDRSGQDVDNFAINFSLHLNF